jgi:CPA2 family monovalent cation:H+ antiporter-2
VVEHYPHIYIVARAVDRHHVYELWAAGCRDIIREHFDSSVRAARSALEALGHHPYDAERQTRGYVEKVMRTPCKAAVKTSAVVSNAAGFRRLPTMRLR